MPGYWSRLRTSVTQGLAFRKDHAEAATLVRRNRELEGYFRTSNKVHEMTGAIASCNLLFRRLTNVKFLLREDIRVISALNLPCESEKDFSMKIGALAGLFEVDLDRIRTTLKVAIDPTWRLPKLIELWLRENGIAYEAGIFQTWQNIKALRNASFPYHPGKDKVVELLLFFGQGFPVHYPELYDCILDKFLDSLNHLQLALNAALSSAKP